MSVWDLHDVIGAKPLWFYAVLCETSGGLLWSLRAGTWEDSKKDLPSITDDEFDQTCVELLGVQGAACECDFSVPDSEAAQPAEERKRSRAEPLERTLSIGTTRPLAPDSPAFAPWPS